MNLEATIQSVVAQSVKTLYNVDVETNQIQIQKTKKEFEGDITVVVFPFVKAARKSPEGAGQEIGEFIVKNNPVVSAFNVIKGFLNLSIDKSYWLETLNTIHANVSFGTSTPTANADTMMIEYSSPNTNKPLHLGHIRNNLLGFSIAEIQKANGWKVVKTNIVNDRGIHICKSMLAWKLFGNGETPASSGMKGDHLVGKYYVVFDKAFKAEIKELMEKGMTEEEAKKSAPLILEAQKMLLAWEQNDAEVRQLWETMNGWVYAGFDETYKQMGVDFDKIYYESETYLTGKSEVERGVTEKSFYQREDSSVWADLTADGLDEKLLLRADGTSVYMTQDIGTAKLRYNDFDIKKMVYVVGNEQNYHFQVLSILLDKLGYAWGKDLVHFSYGMVELPEGKMKSREGTVVDADDLMQEMTSTAQTISEELGKLEGYSEEEKTKLYNTIGLGALKYYILKVDPKKRILFNPEESVDFAGNTGPFIQYTYARIQSIIRKATFDFSATAKTTDLHEKEKELLKQIELYPEVIQNAAQNHSPALIANYTYELVREYNSFYQAVPILGEENQEKKIFRVQLSKKVADTIASSFSLLGINVPERM